MSMSMLAVRLLNDQRIAA